MNRFLCPSIAVLALFGAPAAWAQTVTCPPPTPAPPAPTPVIAPVIVPNAAALPAALAGAKAGGMLVLQFGGPLTISGLTVPGVTLQPAAGSPPLASLTLDKVTGLSLVGFEGVPANTTTSYRPFSITNSHNIAVDRFSVHGSPKMGTGLYVAHSDHVAFTNSTCADLQNCSQVSSSTNVTVSHNDCRRMSADCFDFNDSSFLTITRNHGQDFSSAPGAHSDFVQLWTSGQTSSSHDILIAENDYERGTGAAAQGIFPGDQVGTLPYLNLVIRDNLLVGAQYNGILDTHSVGAVISGNIVTGFSDMFSAIRVQVDTTATLTNNQTQSYMAYPSWRPSGVNLHPVAGITLIAPVTDGGAALLAAWKAAHP